MRASASFSFFFNCSSLDLVVSSSLLILFTASRSLQSFAMTFFISFWLLHWESSFSCLMSRASFAKWISLKWQTLLSASHLICSRTDYNAVSGSTEQSRSILLSNRWGSIISTLPGCISVFMILENAQIFRNGRQYTTAKPINSFAISFMS